MSFLAMNRCFAFRLPRLRLSKMARSGQALAFALLVHCASPRLFAQTPPSALKNLVPNGGFESATRRENLWQGVDSAGYLTGERGQVVALTLSGAITDAPMPVSVSVADMNADGLLDILAMDVVGYLRVYFNSGSKEEPKFTYGELGRDFPYPHAQKRSDYRARVPQRTTGAQDLRLRYDKKRQEGFGSRKLPGGGALCS